MNNVNLDTNRVSTCLLPKEKAALARWCKNNGHTMSYVLMKVIREFLKNQGVKV